MIDDDVVFISDPRAGLAAKPPPCPPGGKHGGRRRRAGMGGPGSRRVAALTCHVLLTGLSVFSHARLWAQHTACCPRMAAATENGNGW
jgi:hypothetical protein